MPELADTALWGLVVRALAVGLALPVVVPRGVRALATAAVCACLVFLVGRPAAAAFGERLWEDGLATSRRVADLFPAEAVVLVGSELAGL